MMSRLHLRHACADAGRDAKSMHRWRPASPAPIPQNECSVTPPEANRNALNHTKHSHLNALCSYQSNRQQHQLTPWQRYLQKIQRMS